MEGSSKEKIEHFPSSTVMQILNEVIFWFRKTEFSKKDIVANICTSISEKSGEAAIWKLIDEGYIERYSTGLNIFFKNLLLNFFFLLNFIWK